MKTKLRVILITLTLLGFGLLPKTQAVIPPPDGGYPGGNTAEGQNALLSRTIGGFNTAVGWFSLETLTTGSFNTGVGAGTLVLNSGDQNTATGAGALLLNTTGSFNTANGVTALESNTTGFFNTAIGAGALNLNTTTNDNTAVGSGALGTSTGTNNTALGRQAGLSSGSGTNNVYLGSNMVGVAGETDHTYIRNINNTSVSGGGTDTVTINLTTGLLGHATSSRRYKKEIKPMDNASQALFALQPVTFRYKKQIDQSQSLDYGLIAEDVAQVDPNLAIRDRNGQIESVRYSAINAMLLNEFLKEHKALLEEQRRVQTLEVALKSVNERLREQDAKIESVSAQIELNRPAPQVVQMP
jgi:hypothetical protein